MKKIDFTYSVFWNLFLLTLGSLLFAIGVKAIALPHGIITGGLSGLALLLHYVIPSVKPGMLLLVMNVPLFGVAWYFMRSRRLLLYSLYGMLVMTIAIDLINFEFVVQNQLYAAIASGIICGAGSGCVLRSLGSGGGLDLVAIIVHRLYNIGIGRFQLAFNAALFSVSIFVLDNDLIIASMIMVFISAGVMDSVLGMFNQRKLCLIISENAEEISHELLKRMRLGGTWLNGRGAFSGRQKDVLMTVISNYHLKRVEQVGFTVVSSALFIVENTFTVLGSTFSKRKVY